MRDYLLLEEFAEQWSSDRGETPESTRAEILRLFWAGRFEWLGKANGPGTILVVREENRANFPDQYFDGMPFGREEFLTQVFFGPCALPEWRHWSPSITNIHGNYDPGGLQFKRRYLDTRSPPMLQEGYMTLRDCPFQKYLFPADDYLRSLGFPLAMLGRYFVDRERIRPPFLIKAQARFSGAVAVGAQGRKGRKRYEFGEALLEDWFRKRVEHALSNETSFNADEAHALAQDEFHPKVPRRLIRDLHKRLAPAEWRRRGRKASR